MPWRPIDPSVPTRLAVAATVALTLTACHHLNAPPQVARFVVSSTPLDVGVTPRPLCIGVDPADREGVWWWEPGTSGCSNRPDGRRVAHADRATVVGENAGAYNVSFRIPVAQDPDSVAADLLDVKLVLQNEQLRSVASGARVATLRRTDMSIPDSSASQKKKKR